MTRIGKFSNAAFAPKISGRTLLPGIGLLLFLLVLGASVTLLWQELFELPESASLRLTTSNLSSTVKQDRSVNHDFSPIVAISSKTALTSSIHPSPSPSAASRQSTRDLIHSTAVESTLDELVQLLNGGERLSVEELAAFHDLLNLLVAQGQTALPALREFLLSGTDVSLNANPQLRYDSLRLALLDVLRRIGGQEALAIALELLHTQVSPKELVVVTNHLQAEAPGHYLAELMEVANGLLMHHSTSSGEELGPLFQMLGEYEGISATELQQLPHYQQQYAAVALALLPDGQGIPALLEEVRQPHEGLKNEQGRLALQLLAQISSAHPDAAQTLVDVAEQGLIPDWLWPNIAALASGRDSIQLARPDSRIVGRHFVYKPEGNQLFYRARPGLPQDAEEARARLYVIEQLLENTSNAAARRVLQPLVGQLESRIRQI